MKTLYTLLFALFIVPTVSNAQYWHSLPATVIDHSFSPAFSNDEKRVFYIAPNAAGIKNVFAVDIKGGTPVEVTHSTIPIVRLMHVSNKPMMIYVRQVKEGSVDFHLYRAKNDGTEELDLTPDADGVTSMMIGASFSGRFVYYTANKQNASKIDLYRYDIQQNLSELVFANDKDFKYLAWSRDQKRLLFQDPATTEVWIYDINSTDRKQLYVPVTPKKVVQAFLNGDNKQLLILEANGGATEFRSMSMSSPTETGDEVKPIESGISSADLSLNGKYLILRKGMQVLLKDAVTLTEVYHPSDEVTDFQTNAKENLILQSCPSSSGGRMLQLYNIDKKTSTVLAEIK